LITIHGFGVKTLKSLEFFNMRCEYVMYLVWFVYFK